MSFSEQHFQHFSFFIKINSTLPNGSSHYPVLCRHYLKNWVSYNDMKIGQQIAGYKAEMCKSVKVRPKPNCCNYKALEKVYQGGVIFHWKLNLILRGVCFLEICSRTQASSENGLFLLNFLFYRKFLWKLPFLAA